MEGKVRFFVLVLALVCGLQTARAEVEIQTPAFREVLYSAKIKWEGADSASLRFKLGKVSGTKVGKSSIFAVITGEAGKTEAVCERMIGYRTGKNYDQVTMLCRGPLFPQASITTFSFPDAMKHPRLIALIHNRTKTFELADE